MISKQEQEKFPQSQQKRIQDLIIVKNRTSPLKIDKNSLQQINSIKNKSKIISTKNVTQVLEEQSSFSDLINLNRRLQRKNAIKMYESAKFVQLLQTGDYCITENDRHLIFSQFKVAYLECKSSSSYEYDGFMYEFSKWLYQGGFRVMKNSIVFDSKDGQMMQRIEKDWVFMKGEWRNGSMITGIREIYEGKVSQQGLKQAYSGRFVDMKYDGEGKLMVRKKITEKFEKFRGIFECGKCIRPIQDELNSKDSSGIKKEQNKVRMG